MLELFAGERALDFLQELDEKGIEEKCFELDDLTSSSFYVESKTPDSSTISCNGTRRFKFSVFTEKEFVHKFQKDFNLESRKDGDSETKVIMVSWIDPEYYDIINLTFFGINKRDIRVPVRYYEEIGDNQNIVGD